MVVLASEPPTVSKAHASAASKEATSSKGSKQVNELEKVPPHAGSATRIDTVSGHRLPEPCGLYLSTSLGPIHSTSRASLPVCDSHS
jgi:hypothetical protein